VQITLPDDQKLRHRAQAAGFASVEEYIQQLVRRDVQQEDVRQPAPDPEQQTAEEWVRDFDAWVRTLKSHNPNFDDSRESIYPVR
jgi:hypothetical protein